MVSQHAELIENDYFILFGELNVLSRLVLSQYQMCSHTYTHTGMDFPVKSSHSIKALLYLIIIFYLIWVNFIGFYGYNFNEFSPLWWE